MLHFILVQTLTRWILTNAPEYIECQRTRKLLLRFFFDPDEVMDSKKEEESLISFYLLKRFLEYISLLGKLSVLIRPHNKR